MAEDGSNHIEYIYRKQKLTEADIQDLEEEGETKLFLEWLTHNMYV